MTQDVNYKNSPILSRNATAAKALRASSSIQKNPRNLMSPAIMPRKKDLAVYDDKDPIEEALERISSNTKASAEIRDEYTRVLGEANTSRALTDDTGKPVTVDEANESVDADAASAREDSLGLMSRSEASDNPVLEGFTAEVEEVKGNSRFMNKLSEMQDKYTGLTEEEIFIALGRESSFGKNMGSIGNAFQIKKTIDGKPNEKAAGIDFDALSSSTDLADHLEAFDTYLSNWKYDGKASVGMMLAAPGKRNAKPNTVIYKKGSTEAEANPGWQNSTGNVTVQSIDQYYRGINK